MTPTVPQQKPKTDSLLEELRGPILKFVQNEVRNTIDPEKLLQLTDIRRHILYWRGNQFLEEVYDNDRNIVDFRPIGGQWTQQTTTDDADDSYDTVINDFRSLGRKFEAVLANAPPNVKAVADNAQNPDHQRRVKKAQRVADLLHALWRIKKQNKKLFHTYYKSGTAFGYVEFVSDGEKFGYVDEPVYTRTPTTLRSLNCPNCGSNTPADTPPAPTACAGCQRPYQPEDMREETAMLPQQTGVTQYAVGCVEHRIESGMRVTTPFDIEELSDADYLLYEGERPSGRVFQAHPELREKFLNAETAYGAGGNAATAAQTTRDLATSPTGTYVAPRRGRLLYSLLWIRPTLYERAIGDITIPDPTGQTPGQRMEFRQALKQNYPKGLKITMVNSDTIAKLENGTMDSRWTISPPESAENAFPDPICKDYVPAQDETNDYANIAKQTYERAIPQVAMDAAIIDMTYQAKYRQLPATIIPVKGGGGDINQRIGKIPHATPDPDMLQYAEARRTHNAEIIGITPPIFGGGGVEQTAYATNLKRNQAMMQLSAYADAGREYWEGVTFNAVMLMAEFSKGYIPARTGSAAQVGVEFIDDIEELLKGGFHFEASDSTPMSYPEQRDQMNKNLEAAATNPGLMDLFGFTNPANIPDFHDLMIGAPGWKVANQDSYDKVMRSIRQLLQGKPTQQPSSAPVGPGMPPQMIDIPSIPVDEWDDHEFFAVALSNWMNTEDADEIRQQNPDGFKNVIAFWKAHKGLSLPPPAAGMPVSGGPKPQPKPNGAPAPALGHLPPPVAQGVPAQQ